MTFRFSKKLLAILIMAIVMAVIALPPSVKTRLPGGCASTTPDSCGLFQSIVQWIKNEKVHLGLDLQGGTQLDYRIDLTRANEKNKSADASERVNISQLTEGVLNTLDRRVNNLGVSEPQIYLSNMGDERHIIVELAGIKDIEEAKRVVGKTIQLEFKEPKESLDTNEKQKIEQSANAILSQVLAKNADFKKIGESVETSDKKIQYRPDQKEFLDSLPAHFQKILPSLKVGQVYSKVLEGSDGYTLSAGGKVTETKGLYIVKFVNKQNVDHETTQPGEDFLNVAKELTKDAPIELTEKIKSDFAPAEASAIWAVAEGKVTPIVTTDKEVEVFKLIKKNKPEKQVKASHILISYAGAERADKEVTRSYSAAKKLARSLHDQVVKDPSKFGEIAQKNSDGPSGPQGGDIGYFSQGQMTKNFEKAAFRMKVGEISDVVETEFGFHVIQVADIKDPREETVNVQKMTIAKTVADAQKSLEKALARTEDKKITKKEDQFTTQAIFFDISPDPWKLTGLDGSHFKSASVTYDELGAPIVAIQFDKEGGELFADLTGRLTGKQMAIFVGGELISAPRVNDKIIGGSAVITGNFDLKSALALANDLNTGAIEAPILLAGQRTISATLGDSALQVSLFAGVVGFILLAIFMIVYYRFLGLIAVLALTVYTIIILFLLSVAPLVMTLAGIAGIILSIGMAVDANILIFERTREELNDGKNFIAALAAGFDRAWSSIRDSNVSSLITCAILWFFGNSIIRGFALMLAIGILISMFSAITVTRTFLNSTVGTWISRSHFLMGTKKLKILNQ
ncbi:protein translocase subunit SecD [Candidatus Peregrinibacteria bacterium]|nr:protein translocase subunit SecD [Candidatus Peregrinibacteria bacterium]